jgi:N-acetyl-gamma-glutamyl-phosphate reductase
MIKAGIIGGAGYTAGELLRLLVHHDEVTIDYVYSTSNAGNKVFHVHNDLLGKLDLSFTASVNTDVDVVFLCLGHGNSKKFLEKTKFSASTNIIDLSNDFRLNDDADFMGMKFVYGLPELNKTNIEKAKYIANPGCFATAIELALLPLAEAGQLPSRVHINATTGATGAGVSPSATTHFSWRDNNFSVYKAFQHQHLSEIEESIAQLQPDCTSDLLFIPNRGNFSRGIFASVYMDFEGSEKEANTLFTNYYQAFPFTHVSDRPIALKQVINTNNAVLNVSKYSKVLLITVAIDNLLKGASGQAIENMNLMFGFDHKTGLNLKGTSF